MQIPPAVRPPPWGSTTSGATRSLISKWRQRFHGRIGKLQVREHVPIPDIRAKAIALWQWWNHCVARAAGNGKRILTVNMDETSICLFQGAVRGNIFIRKGRRAFQDVPRSTRRTCMTHAAFVCDDHDLQQLLPQVVLVNERTVGAREFASLARESPPGVRLVRGRSAWVDAGICARMVRWLAAALAPHTVDIQVVLVFDAARQHITDQVLTACAAANIWPIVVPPRLTWLLQPLDTHVFALYKAHLQKAYQRARIAAADRRVSIAEFLPCVYAAVQQTLDGHDWAHAFEGNGLSRSQLGVSTRILTEAQLEQPLAIGSELPTPEQLSVCLPRRARIQPRRFLRPLASRTRAPTHVPTHTPSAVATGSAHAFVADEQPIAFRTRAGTLRMRRLNTM